MKSKYCEKCWMLPCVCIPCPVCGKIITPDETYEYRGAYSCADCFDVMTEKRKFERQKVIEEQRVKTDKFDGLDLSDSKIGKANKEILKVDIEIAKKEGGRIKEYEKRSNN